MIVKLLEPGYAAVNQAHQAGIQQPNREAMKKGWKKYDAYQLAFELGLELRFELAKGEDQDGNLVANAVANQG